MYNIDYAYSITTIPNTYKHITYIKKNVSK